MMVDVSFNGWGRVDGIGSSAHQTSTQTDSLAIVAKGTIADKRLDALRTTTHTNKKWQVSKKHEYDSSLAGPWAQPSWNGKSNVARRYMYIYSVSIFVQALPTICGPVAESLSCQQWLASVQIAGLRRATAHIANVKGAAPTTNQDRAILLAHGLRQSACQSARRLK